MFPLHGAGTTVHTGIDLLTGATILRGEPAGLAGRVVVYAAVAVSIFLFGLSVKSVLFVVRCFHVLNLWLGYVLTTRLYGVATGLVASALIISSFAVHEVASYATAVDTMVPFFLLVTVLLLHMGLERGKTLYMALAGSALGLGCLTKEVALPFLLLPVLTSFSVPQYRTRPNRRTLLGAVYAMVALVYLPWLTYVWIHTGSPQLLLGLGRPELVASTVGNLPGASSGGYSVLVDGLLWQLPRSAANYYQDFMAPNFKLAPLLVVSIGFVLARAAWLRGGADIILGWSLLLYAPSVVVQGIIGERLGHGLTMFYLGYIAVAVAVVSLARLISATVEARFAAHVR